MNVIYCTSLVKFELVDCSKRELHCSLDGVSTYIKSVLSRCFLYPLLRAIGLNQLWPCLFLEKKILQGVPHRILGHMYRILNGAAK